MKREFDMNFLRRNTWKTKTTIEDFGNQRLTFLV